MRVLTAIGRDQPGIAARLARVLFEAGCNIEDSSMSILCGEFAVILMLSAPPHLSDEELGHRFDAVREDLGLQVSLRHTSEVPKAEEVPDPSYVVTVAGEDHPGIVCRMTELMASQSVNITDLQSKVLRGGERPVYMLVVEIVLPEGLGIEAIQSELDSLAREIGVEVHVNPVDSASL